MPQLRLVPLSLRAAAALATVAVAGFWIGRAQQERPATFVDAGEYPNLQAALDALPPSGGLVRLPPGRFEITEPLVLSRGDVRIEGAGAATHIVNRNEEGRPALHIRPPESEGEIERIWRVQLANFRVSGNPASGDGVLLEYVNEPLVDALSIDHNGGVGLRLVQCYEDPRIVDSIFTYNAAAGVRIEAGHDIVVNGNQFEENQDALVIVDSFNLCMTGNNLDDHLRHGVVVENTYGSVLSGNMIEECAGTAIILDRDVYGFTIGSNVIAHNNGGGVELRDAWGVAISANTFTINPSWSVRIGRNSGRVTLTGNNFSNSYIGGKTIREEQFDAEWPRRQFAAGVLIDGGEDVTLSGNLFAGMMGPAVRAQGASGLLLSGNETVDLHRQEGRAERPFVLDDVDDLVVETNLTR